MPEEAGLDAAADAMMDAAREASLGDAMPDATIRPCTVDPDCDDDDACTVDDCAMGYCSYGTRTCSPESRCQTGRCEPTMGCVYDVMPACPAPPVAPPGCAATTNTFTRSSGIMVFRDMGYYDTFDSLPMAVGTYLWNVSVRTRLRHSFSGDAHLHIRAGQVVALVQGGAGDLDDVYNGTLWDDRADLLPGGYPYVDGVAATPLVPAMALSRFRGTDPNRSWTLSISSYGDPLPMMQMGTLDGWDLTLTTLDRAPSASTAMLSSSTEVPIRDLMTVNGSIMVSGLPTFLCQVEVSHMLEHDRDNQLEMALISPAGTRVVLTRRKGAPTGDMASIRWTDDGPRAIADDYWKLRTGNGLTPEGALGALITEDPNGMWRLEISDRVAETEGTLRSWTLHLTTCRCS